MSTVLLSFFVFVQKMVIDGILFVRNHGIEIDIGHAFENIRLYLRIGLPQGGNQLFRLQSLGRGGAVLMAGSAGISEMAGTLEKMQFIPVPPLTDISLIICLALSQCP